MLKCACGQPLEEGFLGCLWCPVCEDKWKIPEDAKDNPKYYFTLKTGGQEEKPDQN